MKIGPMRAELFHTDGRTDRHDEAKSRLSRYCERAQKPAKNSVALQWMFSY